MNNKNDRAFEEFKKEISKSGLDEGLISRAVEILKTNKGFCYYLLKVMKWPCELIAKTAIENEQFILNGDLVEESTPENKQPKAIKEKQPGDED